jgi:hypothetical protein
VAVCKLLDEIDRIQDAVSFLFRNCHVYRSPVCREANEFCEANGPVRSVNSPFFAAADKTRRLDESQADAFGMGTLVHGESGEAQAYTRLQCVRRSEL